MRKIFIFIALLLTVSIVSASHSSRNRPSRDSRRSEGSDESDGNNRRDNGREDYPEENNEYTNNGDDYRDNREEKYRNNGDGYENTSTQIKEDQLENLNGNSQIDAREDINESINENTSQGNFGGSSIDVLEAGFGGVSRNVPESTSESTLENNSEANTPSLSESTSSTPSDNTGDNFIQTCLDLHNEERGSFGINDLIWDGDLASDSMSWAQHLADTQTMKHSDDRVHVGENLAWRTYKNGVDSTALLINQWIDEKQYFKNGKYPDISTTGDSSDAGHYSQMIWSTTTKLGCAVARGGNRDYIVCRYARSGNVKGNSAY